MLFLLLLQFVHFINIKFHKYQYLFIQPKLKRLKRESNEKNETFQIQSSKYPSHNQNKTTEYEENVLNKSTDRTNVLKSNKIPEKITVNKTKFEHIQNILPQPGNINVESFSFYLNRDKRLDKGSKIEIRPYSQSSFGQVGRMDFENGRFYSDSGGLFMVSATFHVRTEILVVPGHKKKQKRKSFKNNKIQLKLQICSNGKCKSSSEIQSIQALNNFKKIKTSRNSIGSIALLAGQGIVQTCSCSGLVHVGKGEHVSVHAQVTGHVFLLAGSHFSGVVIG